MLSVFGALGVCIRACVCVLEGVLQVSDVSGVLGMLWVWVCGMC